MVTEQKISEAEYFLDRIMEAAAREDFIPNLNAFLSAARSIPEYLLEDYNSKIALNIPLTEKLYLDTFRFEANRQRNQTAIDFITEYKSELDRLYVDPIGNLLTKKKNISIHRSDVAVKGEFEREKHETLYEDGNISIDVRDGYGNSKKRSGSTASEVKPRVLTDEESTPPDSVKWYFDDYQNDDVVIACEKFLDLL